MSAHKILRTLLVLAGLAPIAACLAAGSAITGRVVGADGKAIANAVVFVQDSTDSPPAAAARTATMDQFNKTFVPGVLPVVVGTQVRFPNKDQIRHHVYSFSRAKRFELPLYKGEEAAPVLFDKPGVVTIGCNIHDWMSATILVVPNAHYAMTDADGKFELTGLAPGTYTLIAWHAQSRDKAENIAQRVEVAANGVTSAVDIAFTLSLAPVRARPATRGSRWNE